MTNADFEIILTVEARSNVMLEVVASQFKMTDEQVFREIQNNVQHLRRLLANKGIQYLDLKRALVPSTDRNERAFLFDWSMSSGWYGGEIMHCLLPALNKDTTRSVLAGDWTAQLRPSAALRDSEIDAIVPGGSSKQMEVPDTLYVVYLNSLTSTAESSIDAAFSRLPSYVGSVDMTYGSMFKAMLSTMLAKDFVQHKSSVIVAQDDESDEDDDSTLKLYDFDRFGFKARGIPSWLYGAYLSYKIERPGFAQDHLDSKFSLNAMTPTPTLLAACEVIIEESKLASLATKKAGSLKRAGMAGLSAVEIAAQIRLKLANNYIYSLARSEGVNTLKFNIVLEVNGARILCGLKYQPSERQIKVITLF